jgi:hypothetical protein
MCSLFNPACAKLRTRLCRSTVEMMIIGQLMSQMSTEWQIYTSQLAKLFFKGHHLLPVYASITATLWFKSQP